MTAGNENAAPRGVGPLKYGWLALFCWALAGPSNVGAEPGQWQDLRAVVERELGADADFDIDEAMRQYEALKGHRAVAAAYGGGNFVYGTGYESPALLGASMTAMQQCETQRIRHEIPGPCEIVRSNDVAVAMGEAIRGDGLERHPISLWRVEREGRVLWLAGSVHVLKSSLYPLHEPILKAWEASESLVMEIDPIEAASPDTQMMALQMGTLPEGQVLQDVLPERLLILLRDRINGTGGDFRAVQRFSPIWTATILSQVSLAAIGYLPQHGMEASFVQRAQARGIEVSGIESPKEQFSALLNHPLSVQIALLEDVLRDEQEVADELATLLRTWWRGDSQLFLDLFDDAVGENEELRGIYVALLDDRNFRMAERIETLLDTEAVEFVLIGTAHMPGGNGLVELLRKRGATVEQMYTDSPVQFAERRSGGRMTRSAGH